MSKKTVVFKPGLQHYLESLVPSCSLEMSSRLANVLKSIRNNRRIVLAIVSVAILLDNVVLTAIVPILPECLFKLDHPNDTYIGSDTYPFGQHNRINNITNERNYALLSAENVKSGIMLGSKAVTQFIVNIFIGPITNRIGFTIPMFAGFVTLFLSTLLFAFGGNYFVLLFARAMQGVGSACMSTSGMGLLAKLYTDDVERGAAMGLALGGVGLGALVGPPFGGILYKFGGKELPFLILAAATLLDGILQLLVLTPTVEKNNRQEATSLGNLLKDPYIMIAAGGLAAQNMGVAVMEPTLPIWMIETMGSGVLVIGVAFLPASFSYMVGVNIFGRFAHKCGRWLVSLAGMVLVGLCLIAIPFTTSVLWLIAPIGFYGLAMAMVCSSIFPMMGHLVDIRHTGIYGNVYAIADAAFCLTFALGPFISGPIVEQLGFAKLMFIVASLTFLYAPLLIALRNPKAKSEETLVKPFQQ